MVVPSLLRPRFALLNISLTITGKRGAAARCQPAAVNTPLYHIQHCGAIHSTKSKAAKKQSEASGSRALKTRWQRFARSAMEASAIQKKVAI